jgi:hypothetical protein
MIYLFSKEIFAEAFSRMLIPQAQDKYATITETL